MATSLGTARPPSNTLFLQIGSTVFSQMTTECDYTLQYDAPFPLKIAPFHGGSKPPFNTWFLGSTQVLNLNSISIGAAVFAGLTSVTDRQTMLLSR